MEALKELSKLYGVTLEQLMGVGPEPEEESAPAPKVEQASERSYRTWTIVLLLVTVAIETFSLNAYGQGTLPFSLFAMILGVWLRYPAMWVILQCLLAVDAVGNGINLLWTGRVLDGAQACLDLIYLWAMNRTEIRKRFHDSR